MDFRPKQRPSGAVRQSGLSPNVRSPSRLPALFVRGVVVATYVTDDPQNPDAANGNTPTAVYCDVLSYSDSQGPQRIFLPRCLVSQDLGNMQSGVVYRPRAASQDVSGQPLDLGSCAIGQLDGDHVLVSFLEGDMGRPVIVRGLPHPSADIGQAANQAGNGAHLKLKLVDGSPYMVKNNGSYFGIDTTGNFVADSRYANDGHLIPGGAEPGPPSDDSLGNQIFRMHALAQRLTEFYDMATPSAPVLALQDVLTASGAVLKFISQPASVSVSDAQGNSFNLGGSGADTMTQLGNGAVHVAIAEHLQTLYTSLYTWLATHTHPTATGLSGPPTAPPPAYDVSINSTHLSIPDL